MRLQFTKRWKRYRYFSKLPLHVSRKVIFKYFQSKGQDNGQWDERKGIDNRKKVHVNQYIQFSKQ